MKISIPDVFLSLQPSLRASAARGLTVFSLLIVSSTPSSLLAGGYIEDWLGPASLSLAPSRTTDGLVAHWSLNETEGSTAFDSAGAHAATLMDGAIWTEGRHGGAVRLDGPTGYLAPPGVDVYGSALTMAAWVNVTSYPASLEQRIISKATGIAADAQWWTLSQVRIDGRNVLAFQLKAGGATTTLVASSGNLATKAWYHAAATYDGSMMRLYLDGVEVGLMAKAGAIDTNPAVPVNIGRSPEGSNYLRGMIDDVRIYNRALAAEDLTLVMADSGDPLPDATPPSTPDAVVATGASPTQIQVQWSASTDNEAVTGYTVRRNGVAIATTAVTTYADAGLVASTTYTYTVTAVDAAGNESAESEVAAGTTAANGAPSIALTAPAGGTTYTAPATLTLAASASDPENDLSDVQFFAGATLLSTDASAPYEFTWTSVAAGSYSVTAVARDRDGGVTTSAAVTVTVAAPNQPPTVAITAPTGGATFAALTNVTVTAAAADPENRLTEVLFYAGGVLLARDTAAPYAYTWASVPAGIHSLTAVARDANGGSATSSPVAITVAAAPAPLPWRVAFTASTDHETNVTSYLLEIFGAGADPNVATPIRSSDLGKPALGANREIVVDRTALFEGLPAGSYVMTVRALSAGGSTRSTSMTFMR